MNIESLGSEFWFSVCQKVAQEDIYLYCYLPDSWCATRYINKIAFPSCPSTGARNRENNFIDFLGHFDIKIWPLINVCYVLSLFFFFPIREIKS